jgi:hypothetical protein
MYYIDCKNNKLNKIKIVAPENMLYYGPVSKTAFSYLKKCVLFLAVL